MKKIIFLLFLTTSFCFGQNFFSVVVTDDANGTIGLPSSFLNQDTSRWETIGYVIKGNPYQANEYAEGSTTILNKKGFNAPMRYNAAKDVIEFLDDDQKVKEVLRRPYIKAKFNGKTYEVIAYLDNGKERLAYFNKLNSGETQLLFQPKKQINISSQTFQGKKEARYQDASMYFIQKKGKPAEMIRLNQTDLLLTLSDKKAVLTKFIADYHLNLKKEADAVRLVEYYNSLISPQPMQEKGQS
ncbi:MAG: hypothetical protein AB8B59_03370 [Maribacter sp.]